MQSKQPFIQRYSIGDVSAELGSEPVAKDFHVFSSDEGRLNESLLGRPVRSDHFTVVLIVKGEAAIKHNLIDYILPQNSLFIITPQIVHQFQEPFGEYHIVGMAFRMILWGKPMFLKNTSMLLIFFLPKASLIFFLLIKKLNLWRTCCCC